MKRLVLLLACFSPAFSFASVTYINSTTDTVLEQCAKEQDPIKRQNSCHMLDRHSKSIEQLPDFHKEIVTV